jgi:DNA-binding XRE family transcriptional regulator
MPFHIGPDITPLVGRARVLLGLTQKELGGMFRASMRTAHRWEGGEARPSIEQVQELARAVFPLDASLAGALAQEAGTTLGALGLVATPKAPSASSTVSVAPVPVAAARAFPPVALMIDSIVLAAVDAVDGNAARLDTRQSVREILRAGFARARGLGLTIEEVDAALASPPQATALQPKSTPPKK